MLKSNAAGFAATLSELIAAAGEVAFEYSDSDKEGYEIARQALIQILRNGSRLGDFYDPNSEPLANRFLH
ncbi:MAG TPA: hypothetical protein VNN77_13945 [candidate division Zixibacteria bacterium]|nr:hypothetical protein [candidate division Zixibacteria bacterium]